MKIVQAPEHFGTTPCEYFVTCTHQTSKLAVLPFGLIPICDQHVEWVRTH